MKDGTKKLCKRIYIHYFTQCKQVLITINLKKPFFIINVYFDVKLSY